LLRIENHIKSLKSYLWSPSSSWRTKGCSKSSATFPASTSPSSGTLTTNQCQNSDRERFRLLFTSKLDKSTVYRASGSVGQLKFGAIVFFLIKAFYLSYVCLTSFIQIIMWVWFALYKRFFLKVCEHIYVNNPKQLKYWK